MIEFSIEGELCITDCCVTAGLCTVFDDLNFGALATFGATAKFGQSTVAIKTVP